MYLRVYVSVYVHKVMRVVVNQKLQQHDQAQVYRRVGLFVREYILGSIWIKLYR